MNGGPRKSGGELLPRARGVSCWWKDTGGVESYREIQGRIPDGMRMLAPNPLLGLGDLLNSLPHSDSLEDGCVAAEFKESDPAMSEESLTLSVRHIKKVTVIDLKGRLIMGEPVDRLNAQVKSLIKEGSKHLAINLAGVSYVDSSGIASMAQATNIARKAGGECEFFAATSRVLQLLRVTRVDSALIVLADEDSALSSFQQKSKGS